MLPKHLYTLLITFSSLFAHSQVQVALFAGPQTTSAHYVVSDNKQPTQFKYGFMAGVGMKVPFDGPLYFFPSVNYSLKGYKVTLNNPAFPPTEFAKNNNTTIHTMDIAPLLQLDFSGSLSGVFIRFGPSVDFAFSGKERFDTVSTNGTTARVERNMVFSFGDYGRISASANFHLGFESRKGFMIYGFYNHGIGSMNNADFGPRILHRIVGISFGWLLGHNPQVMDTRVRE